MFGVSKLFINDDIPDIRNFKQKLIENRSHEGDDHCVTHLTTFSSYSIKNDFLNNLPKVCINDIRDIGKDVLSVTGDNMALRDDEKSTTSSPGKSKLLNVIDVDNDPSLYSIKKSCFL
ncbi:hypothetical protein Tco_1403102 [Tanacetum coccineum]